MILAILATLAVMAVYLWQDGVYDCNDGRRYTSMRAQPYPFHRRFCWWPKRLLQVTSWGSIAMLGSLMGDWKRALLLMTLPGAWFVVSHPTTVDAPAMLLAWCASLLMPTHPYVAVALSCVSGVIHERGPVFAALYAWHPLLLLGLVGVGWWRKAAAQDSDKLVGGGFLHSLRVSRPYNDFLDAKTTFLGLRGLPLMAAYFGVGWQAWVTLAVAWASRAVGTDFGRFVWWAAPALVVKLPDVPLWMVALQIGTFRRCI